MTSPEVSKHDLIKSAIFSACNDLGLPAIQEHKGKDWRADVYVTNGSKKFAFEVQMTPQSLNRTLERQAKYIRDNVFGCWLFEKPLPKLSEERPDLPLFYVKEQEDKSLSVSLSDRKELPLHDFIRQLLAGNIKFCDVARTAQVQKVKIVFYEMECWKCKVMNHIYYVKPAFRSACNAEIHASETLWGSDRNVHRPEIVSLVRKFIETSQGKHLKLGEIKKRPSKMAEDSYMSFGCYKCDSIFGEWFVRDAELDVMYGYGEIASIERNIKLGENIEYPIPHWCYPGELPFCDTSPSNRDAAIVNLDNTFERRQKLSVYWHNKASDLRGSAGALWASMHDSNASATAERLGLGQGFSFIVACWPVYQMLCGMAIELLIKATLVARGIKPKTTHDLVLLCKDARISLTDTQTGLLRILSEAIIWDGRYPVPKQESHFHEHTDLCYEYLFDQISSSSSLKLRRPNGSLNWESFEKLWESISVSYEPHR